MKRTRKSLKYRLFHWMNQLTINDVRNITHTIIITLFEIATIILLFAILFIFPAVFH